MCGRYLTPDEKEIRPGDIAEVLLSSGKRCIHWGLKLSNNQLLINARSETAAHKPLFQRAMLHGRCIIAASSFYEWDEKKRCHVFTSSNNDAIYMAALILPSDDGKDHFVILTQSAQGEARSVHPRMPCLLPTPECRHLWLNDDMLAPHLLAENMELNVKRRQTDNEQLDFFTS